MARIPTTPRAPDPGLRGNSRTALFLVYNPCLLVFALVAPLRFPRSRLIMAYGDVESWSRQVVLPQAPLMTLRRTGTHQSTQSSTSSNNINNNNNNNNHEHHHHEHHHHEHHHHRCHRQLVSPRPSTEIRRARAACTFVPVSRHASVSVAAAAVSAIAATSTSSPTNAHAHSDAAYLNSRSQPDTNINTHAPQVVNTDLSRSFSTSSSNTQVYTPISPKQFSSSSSSSSSSSLPTQFFDGCSHQSHNEKKIDRDSAPCCTIM
ncbi:hypothetical protein V1514DRAFT_352472 [Lipomyces japonicus]|uniref:uncharacterized protein n=1 Tax=Lipomyces japonicus TaxID=56871 RepID=UPI0034CE9B9D